MNSQLSTDCQKAFCDAMTARHNQLRAKHGVKPLTQDATLSAGSIPYADVLVSKNALVHSGGPYGENLAGNMSSLYTSATIPLCTR